MTDYLYNTFVYHTTTTVIGVNQAEEEEHTTDFETNYKSQCLQVSKIIPLTTTFDIVLPYDQFKAKITGDILWSDVKYVDDGKAYNLVLITDSPL